jgi:hypothetical protein
MSSSLIQIQITRKEYAKQKLCSILRSSKCEQGRGFCYNPNTGKYCAIGALMTGLGDDLTTFGRHPSQKILRELLSDVGLQTINIANLNDNCNMTFEQIAELIEGL